MIGFSFRDLSPFGDYVPYSRMCRYVYALGRSLHAYMHTWGVTNAINATYALKTKIEKK